MNVTGSCGSPDGQLYAILPATCISFDPVRAKSMRLRRNVSAENSTCKTLLIRFSENLPFPAQNYSTIFFVIARTNLSQASDKIIMHSGAQQCSWIDRTANVHSGRGQHRKFPSNMRMVRIYIVYDGNELRSREKNKNGFEGKY